jgi:hypothetical protein
MATTARRVFPVGCTPPVWERRPVIWQTIWQTMSQTQLQMAPAVATFSEGFASFL